MRKVHSTPVHVSHSPQQTSSCHLRQAEAQANARREVGKRHFFFKGEVRQLNQQLMDTFQKISRTPELQMVIGSMGFKVFVFLYPIDTGSLWIIDISVRKKGKRTNVP